MAVDVHTWRSALADGVACYRVPFREALLPPPNLAVWEWADRYRVLSAVSSAEPGRWRTSRTPYLREILECLSPASPIRKVVFRKSAQVGGTEAGNNWVAYNVDNAVGPMLIVQPTVEMAKRWSKQRLAPMLRDTPKIAGKVASARSRDSGNTLQSKEFDGGILLITGANSAVGLRSMPAAWLFFDEVDEYPFSVDEQGHPIELGERRANTFWYRKVLETSTPKTRFASRIDSDFEASDRAFYFVPCPTCNGMQTLEDDRLLYGADDPRGCHEIACALCGVPIDEGHKAAMLARGEWWRLDGYTWGARPPDPAKPAGFHINALYSPPGWLSWGEIAELREQAKTDESKARSYRNTILGLSYEEHSDAPDWEVLYQRRLGYAPGVVPPGAYMLVAGADVQRDRIEIGWYAFGPEFEGWMVDHHVIEGNVAEDATWHELTKVQARRFAHAEGSRDYPADLFLIDMGYATEAVKVWVTKMRQPRRIRAVRGEDVWGSPAIIGRSKTELTWQGKKATRGFGFWKLAVSSIKLELYRRLRRPYPDTVNIGDPPFGGPWLHYPQVSEEWFKQLTAERLVQRQTSKRRTKPRTRLEWELTRNRNEALDLTVYALAAGYMLKAEQMEERHWKRWATRWGLGQMRPVVRTEEPVVESGGDALSRTPAPRGGRRARRARRVRNVG